MELQPALPTCQPTTFAERGVSLQLTTPLLRGARMRLDAQRRLELLLPNLSGRGICVLTGGGWGELGEITLHDTLLIARLQHEGATTPRSVRLAAREVAIGGAAGRMARAAALRAQHDAADSLQATTRYVLDRLAAEGQAAAPQQAAALACVLDPLGIGAPPVQAVLPLRLNRLRNLRAGLAAWAASCVDDTGRLAAAVHALADIAVRCACVLIQRVAAQPVADLLAAWRLDRAGLTTAAARPDWVLDGWDPACHLWRAAVGVARQRASLVEIAALAPVLPQEVACWTPGIPVGEMAESLRRLAVLNQRWPHGLAGADLVARNELLLALAA